MNNNRPKIKIALTGMDRLFEICGWLLLTALWVFTIAGYSDLPATIPRHYNAEGVPYGFGPRAMLFILPCIVTVLFTGLTVLSRYPHIFNYPVSITNENAQKQYRYATSLLRYLKCILVVIFGLIVLQTMQTAKGQAMGLGIWFLPLVLALIFIPLAYFVVMAKRRK